MKNKQEQREELAAYGCMIVVATVAIILIVTLIFRM
jgi:hypothetical protein